MKKSERAGIVPSFILKGKAEEQTRGHLFKVCKYMMDAVREVKEIEPDFPQWYSANRQEATGTN